MIQITPAIVQASTGCTPARAVTWAGPLQQTCERFDIDASQRIAWFLAQIGHESGGLQFVREIWGPTGAQARYEGRADLGNTQPGDGKRYMGRGLIQITGRSNYAQVRDGLRKVVDGVPDFIEVPIELERLPWAALSAGWYWKSRNLNVFADSGDFITLTKRINGGLNGIEDRQRLRAAAERALEVTWDS